MTSNNLLRGALGSSLLLLSPLLFAQSFDDMAEMDISDLMYLEVTSVSKKSQKISEAAASIYVLTQDDLQRSGTNSVPEALRMVPGLSVAQLDANKWAISARGFNHLYSNKLLVLVDGVTVYSPLFSGVHWEAQDLLLENIDRIEVIRGPGATLWGANAVNGVINITTKHAKDTHGIQITQRLGTNDKSITTGRFGGEIGNAGHFRVFSKVRQTRDSVDSEGNSAADGWEQVRTGMRADWQQGENNAFTLQMNHYQGKNGETLSTPTPINPFNTFAGYTTKTFTDKMAVSGSSLLGRWTHTLSSTSEFTVQTYLDTQKRKETIFEEGHDTADIELQHHISLGGFQEIIWGGGYRYMKSKTIGSETYSFTPAQRNTKLLNLFIQDEVTIIPDTLTTVLGVKLENNDFTGKEIQPNARIIFTPTPRQSYWAAISRAVRTPSLNDSDANINSGVHTSTSVNSLKGNPNFESEDLTAFELGFRANPISSVTIDASAYYHRYKNLQGVSFLQTSLYPTIDLEFNNLQTGIAKGVDLSINWQPTIRWKLLAGYSYLDLTIDVEGNSESQAIASANAQASESPKHQLQLRSYFDINHDIQFNTMLFHVDSIEIKDVNNPGLTGNQKIDSYNRLDANISWQANKSIKITSGVNNLLDKQHKEFGNVPFVDATEIERSIYAQVNIDLK